MKKRPESKPLRSQVILAVGQELRNAIYCDNCKGVPYVPGELPNTLLSCPLCAERIADRILALMQK